MGIFGKAVARPEERVLEAYYSRLTAYAVEKSRVMVIKNFS